MKNSKFKIESFIRNSLRIPFRLHVRYSQIVSPTATTYIFIHGLADSGEMWRPIVEGLPKNVNFVVMDLLGHGDSRQFKGSVYSANYQARNVMTTVLSLGCIGQYIFIGHSFGSIVAVECARRNLLAKELILCSLPLYNKPSSKKLNLKEPESLLFEIYRQSLKHPKSTVALYRLIDNLKLGGLSRTHLSEETFLAFKETLVAGIMNQKTGLHLSKLNIPISIIYGKLDPLIIGKNITKVASSKPNIKVKVILNDHAMRRTFMKAVLAEINSSIESHSR